MTQTRLSVEEGNALIEQFMKIGAHNYLDSWNFLMPVVERINEIDNRKFNLEIYYKDARLTSGADDLTFPNGMPRGAISASAKTTIEAVWSVVTQFIQWYNNQKSKP